MKTKICIIGIMLWAGFLYAQVGIGNTAPKSILDIQASDQATPSNTDGLLIPRVDAFPLTDPGADQDGMLIFLTTDSKFYYWKNSIPAWVLMEDEDGKHYVGELWGGGIVYYIYENGKHGLIASLDDLGGASGVDWGPKSNITSAESWWDGATNTTAAVAAGPANTDAVKQCDDYSNDGYTDWYLPSASEFKAMEEAAYVLSKILDSDGDSNTNPLNYYDGEYWTSTQESRDDAFSFKFQNTHIQVTDKDSNLLVRAVRSF